MYTKPLSYYYFKGLYHDAVVNNLRMALYRQQFIHRLPMFFIFPEFLFVFLFLRVDPDPFHSGFVYSQALAVKDGLLPAKEFISPYGVISPFLNGLWLRFVNDSLISLLLLYGTITVASGFLVQLFVTRIATLKLGILLNLVWVMTLATAMPWPSILTTFFTLFSLYILYANSDSLNADYAGSYLKVIPVVVLLQFSVLTRIHLLVTPIVITIFILVYRKSINPKFVQYWFVSNFTSGAILMGVLEYSGILRPFFNQVIVWPLTSFENPPINISFVFSFIWFPLSLLLALALSVLLFRAINNSSSRFWQTLCFSLVTIFFFAAYKTSVFDFKNANTNTLKTVPGFLKNASVYLQFWPLLAAAMVSVIAVISNHHLHFKRKTISNPLEEFRVWLMTSLVITGLIQLYPLHDNVHLWFVGPLFIIPAIHFLTLRVKFFLSLIPSVSLVLASFIAIQSLSLGYFMASPRVGLESSELKGMKASTEYKMTTDESMILLAKYVQGRNLRNNCAASLYSISNRKYRSIDGNFSEGFFSNFTSFTPAVDPSNTPATMIFECAIKEADIVSLSTNGYEVIFKVKHPQTNSPKEPLYNVLFKSK
jgi:hypothetical protein